MKRTRWMMWVIPLLLTACNQTNTYYIDASNGNDKHRGTSPEKAWKTLEKTRHLSLKAGDRILLKRGETFVGELFVSGQGEKENPIVIDAYGTGEKPCIQGKDTSLFAVCLFNSEYIELKNLEVVNHGSKRLPKRTGVKVHLKDFGTARNTLLQGLDIHDVNGSLVKKEGGGSGIWIVNEGDSVPSAFDGLTIEDCTVKRCERNAMIWSGYWRRDRWNPNKNVVVRRNLIEEVPGDGIVPIGCDSAIIEYNIMRNCPDLLPPGEAAAGIWPWSCDNTIIRFNEAAQHKAPWDAQGYDSDYNCRNTCIEYNYSHDNDGGFLLICSDGGSKMPYNIGNQNSVIRYNISINDGLRQRATHTGYFSPAIHIAGPATQSLIYRNIIHLNEKQQPSDHRGFVCFTSWGGWADTTRIEENLFYSNGPAEFSEAEAKNNRFKANYYLGAEIKNRPDDPEARNNHNGYETLTKEDKFGKEAVKPLLQQITLPVGVITTVNPEAIKEFFDKENS